MVGGGGDDAEGRVGEALAAEGVRKGFFAIG